MTPEAPGAQIAPPNPAHGRSASQSYDAFLRSKRSEAQKIGFEIADGDINPMLFPFQHDIVKWALRLGRAAIFADCGLGKTPMQLEWARHVCSHTGGNVLILAPLAVSAQTRREGEKFGIGVTVCKTDDYIIPGINITNYERIQHFDAKAFSGIVLDESSILKSYSGHYKQLLIELFTETPFKLACTATPAPNDHMEIGNHAEFLNIMPSNEMLARWFINDTQHMGRYRLKGHGVRDFWTWVSSWAVCLQKPSDIGEYDDSEFVLPPLNKIIHELEADKSIASDGMLFRIPEMSATGMHKELRLTCAQRAQKVGDIINGNPDSWVVWCNTNYEADALLRVLEGATDIRGSMSPDEKERRLLDFVNFDSRIIITKPDLAGFGMNWQHCHNQVFTGLSYSYEKYYQAVRRCWRFGQKNPVDVHIVMTDTEKPLYVSVMKKEEAHEAMQQNMNTTIKTIDQLGKRRALSMNSDYRVESGRSYEMRLGDSCEIASMIEMDSVDFSIFSPPFSSLYIYSDSARDMGNSTNDEKFFEHFKFLIPELLRVTRPGRLCAVHCKNLVYYKNQRGSAGLRDFRGEIIRSFIECGWDYHSEVIIWKDPVTEMQRTKAHGLLHKQLCKDSSFSRQGLPDYLVIFRKWIRGDSDEEKVNPVNIKDERLRFPSHYIGEEGPANVQSMRDHSIQTWQRYASPVWFDINQMNVLNVRQAREDRDEKHICPLQLDVIERSLHLWTNEGDLIFDPFAGIGSSGFAAIKMGRRFLGIELKESYFEQAIKYLKEAEAQFGNLDLFASVDAGQRADYLHGESEKGGQHADESP